MKQVIEQKTTTTFTGLWFVCWLFTWGFAHLLWWQGFALWPYFLGAHL